jgi:hypothetical protein
MRLAEGDSRSVAAIPTRAHFMMSPNFRKHAALTSKELLRLAQ